ncbi:MAG: hypothetical protein WAV20_26470 [Blastocatellia bacterium]
MKAITLALTLSLLLSCDGAAPPPSRSNAQPFSLISEQADPAAGSITLVIKVTGPPTELSVKSIAESIIANRKGEYRHILVKTYTEGATASEAPFAVSRLEGETVTHRFNSMAGNQKIQTH